MVDDDPTNVEVLRVRLSAQGYEVVTAIDGEEGLQRARDSLYARARVNVNLELSRSGNGARNGFRRPDGRGSGQFAESALDTLYVARNRGRIDIVAF